MSLTRVDCQVFRGKGASLDTSSYIAINPSHRPGSLVLAGAAAARESIGSQVACKLGLEHFVDGVLSYYAEQRNPASETSAEKSSSESEISLEVLEAAFRNANSSVYNFGHKLAAGGRLSASLLGVVLEDKFIAAGRVGDGTVYLFRDGELLPFFEPTESSESEARGNDSYIGSNSMVSVELASIAAREGDILLVLPSSIEQGKEPAVKDFLVKNARGSANPSADLCKCAYGDVFRIPFLMYARVGPETIYLAEAV